MIDLQVDLASTAVPVLQCGGRITLGSPSLNFKSKCLELLDQSPVIAVELANVKEIDKMGIDAIVSVLNAARDRNGQVRLLSPSPVVEEALKSVPFGNEFRLADYRCGSERSRSGNR